MLVEVANIPVKLDAMLPGNEGLLSQEVSKACGCRLSAAEAGAKDLPTGTFRIIKRSVDARKKANVHFVLAVVANVDSVAQLDPAKGVSVKEHVPPEPLCAPDLRAASERPDFHRPVIVGAGPAGLFCAYYLALAGLKPLVVERGKPVGERTRDVDAFVSGGSLNPNSNVQFGEGGAGTFSDGKLTTGTKDPHIRHVLQAFVDAGAPGDILIDGKPHIGTDLLPDVIGNLRKRIELAGGQFEFSTLFCGVREESDALVVELQNLETGAKEEARTDALVLAIGHSARDTFAMLRDAGIAMERKPFAVGVRIEHPQVAINEAQYGPAASHPALGAADYKLAVHNEDGRGVYTFCMCPGGTVVAAASELGRVCVNGMSNHARDGKNANSALLVEVKPDDLSGDDVLEGVRLQRAMEAAAYELAVAAAGISFAAPAQTVGDFLAGDGDKEPVSLSPGLLTGHSQSKKGDKLTGSSSPSPTYPRGVAWVDLHDCLPDFVSAALEEALPALDRKLHGFADPDAIMTGVEARSSSPIKMMRDRGTFQSVSSPRIYPAGEGAGYAGGIMSAAVDGIRTGEAVAVSYGADLWRKTEQLPGIATRCIDDVYGEDSPSTVGDAA